ncbi:MAG: hypothetical protein ACE5JX_09300 [Acidobacteriota bacterium]
MSRANHAEGARQKCDTRSAASRDTDRQLSDFPQRVEREATRRRFSEVARQVVLGDGTKWIWILAEELFPEAIQIVDRHH